VEFSKTVLKEAGFDFLFNRTNGSFSFGLASNLSNSLPARTPASAAFQLVTGLTRDNLRLATSLQLIESNGLARVLAQPSLTALSGQSASFLAGGELPIPQSGGLGTTTIVYKPFGIGLTVTPTVLASNRIALKVAPEASDVDYMNALVTDSVAIPAITTRRAETTLELGDGESFVIGGLVSRSTKSNLSKVPFLGDLPIIGTFFRNMRYTQDEKELVIIVTPRLVHSIAKGTQLALPGEDKERRDIPTNAWGAYLLGTAGRDDLPGFSK
jgi:pilus assembly protein CpaC